MTTADKICGILWGNASTTLYLLTGLLFALICARAIFRARPHKAAANRDKRSILRAVTTALAASMGTGNITGVAAAITIGGAGAALWMCVAAIFGSFIAFAETVLGVHYRYENNGVTVGGPPAYMEKGIGSKKTAAVYCAVCSIMALGMGAMAQSNSVTSAVLSQPSADIPAWLCAAVVTLISGAVIIGGRKRIGAVCEKLVPIMSVLYLVGCVILIVKFRENIPKAVTETVNSAFGLRQAAGGISGYGIKRALSVGLRRGIFSNEAGLGSASVVHSQADASALTMGRLAAAEVLFDTVVCCTATAAVVITTGAYKNGADGAAMVIEGFYRGYGSIAVPYVTAAICLFAFATIIGWEYCGERCLDSLTSGSGRVMYRLLYCAALFFGGAAPLGMVWSISDILNWLAAMINIAALLILAKKLRKIISDA